jgi:hypothetical protein
MLVVVAYKLTFLPHVIFYGNLLIKSIRFFDSYRQMQWEATQFFNKLSRSMSIKKNVLNWTNNNLKKVKNGQTSSMTN